MIVKMRDLPKIKRSAQALDLPIGFIAGGFDVLHAGHRQWLKNCRKIMGSGILVVIICNDEVLRAIKGERRPLDPEQVRSVAVMETGYADYVVIDPETKFRGMVHLGVLERLRPDVWITPEHGLIPMATKELVAERLKIRLVVKRRTTPPCGVISTSKIIEEVREMRMCLDENRKCSGASASGGPNHTLRAYLIKDIIPQGKPWTTRQHPWPVPINRNMLPRQVGAVFHLFYALNSLLSYLVINNRQKQ